MSQSAKMAKGQGHHTRLMEKSPDARILLFRPLIATLFRGAQPEQEDVRSRASWPWLLQGYINIHTCLACNIDELHIAFIHKKLYYVVLMVADLDCTYKDCYEFSTNSAIYCTNIVNPQMLSVPFLLILTSLSSFEEVSRAVLTFLSVGII